jgi:hypothetical protein
MSRTNELTVVPVRLRNSYETMLSESTFLSSDHKEYSRKCSNMEFLIQSEAIIIMTALQYP